MEKISDIKEELDKKIPGVIENFNKISNTVILENIELIKTIKYNSLKNKYQDNIQMTNSKYITRLIQQINSRKISHKEHKKVSNFYHNFKKLSSYEIINFLSFIYNPNKGDENEYKNINKDLSYINNIVTFIQENTKIDINSFIIIFNLLDRLGKNVDQIKKMKIQEAKFCLKNIRDYIIWIIENKEISDKTKSLLSVCLSRLSSYVLSMRTTIFNMTLNLILEQEYKNKDITDEVLKNSIIRGTEDFNEITYFCCKVISYLEMYPDKNNKAIYYFNELFKNNFFVNIKLLGNNNEICNYISNKIIQYRSVINKTNLLDKEIKEESKKLQSQKDLIELLSKKPKKLLFKSNIYKDDFAYLFTQNIKYSAISECQCDECWVRSDKNDNHKDIRSLTEEYLIEYANYLECSELNLLIASAGGLFQTLVIIAKLITETDKSIINVYLDDKETLSSIKNPKLKKTYPQFIEILTKLNINFKENLKNKEQCPYIISNNNINTNQYPLINITLVDHNDYNQNINKLNALINIHGDKVDYSKYEYNHCLALTTNMYNDYVALTANIHTNDHKILIYRRHVSFDGESKEIDIEEVEYQQKNIKNKVT